ncbi:uncharacterized protein LOC129292629 [Prosopis cineraria]|uniref:uncharacterized protein LOC129292629 n=1 Tax=Prosopis cineraria TaxID=364024 RepID=UPI0024106092|nr:uncharacterized protein LOC129292629 [Prosopis cineraria]
MASWSAENATKAYLSAFKMSERSKEPDVTEFISAIAAGSNAQQMVVTSASVPDCTILLAMVAAAHQTQGRVICIASSPNQVNPTKTLLGTDIAGQVEFLVGEPQELLTSSEPCKDADFIVVDCELENHEEIFKAVCVRKKKKEENGTVVVGYNAMKCEQGGSSCWGYCGTRTQLLPIGKGLLVTRFGDFGGTNVSESPRYSASGLGKFKSRWIVKVDNCTGEEHVFRVRLPHDKVVPAT